MSVCNRVVDDFPDFVKTVKEEIRKAAGVKKIQVVFGRYDFARAAASEASKEWWKRRTLTAGFLIARKTRALSPVTLEL